MINGGRLTVPNSTTNPKRIFELTVDVGGVVSIDSTSTIDANAKGYPVNYYGPNYTNHSYSSCHGGDSRPDDTTGCQTYGRFEKAEFAGGGGNRSNGNPNGGGVIQLTANSLQLDGQIRANANPTTYGSYYDYYGGAGGGIHIDVATTMGGS